MDLAFPKNTSIPAFQAHKTRFAPSPTGYLHRGHIWSALQVWAAAQATGAQVHLRIEDHDRSRCREAHVDAIRSDLEWLGFHWQSESRQSQHDATYANALEKLGHAAQLYYCDCGRSRIEQEGRPAPDGSGEIIYSGRCRQRNHPAEAGCALRLRLPESLPVAWKDARLGNFLHDPTQQCGDILLKDRTGQWTYQFAVVVDDMDEGIDLVVRGEDLLFSTARQIYLAQLLGRSQPPAFMHHSLLADAQGRKLSKRDQAASVRSERESGTPREQLLGEVCAQAQLIASFRPLETEEALALAKASLPF